MRQDDYEIAKLIAISPVPVVTAIGHTRDTTVLDLTVFHSAKTPSDAAYFFIEHVRTLHSELNEYFETIQLSIEQRYTQQLQSVEQYITTIKNHIDEHTQKKLNEIEILITAIRLYSPTVLLNA